ncbi:MULTISPECIES: transporter substrate-binding domain-containing protein [unclassified Paenibacillus]|uniref:transporter substrate-binding domain-containing protein n=1 Tax=unclassified Paenibacillus TaxID=185978 RepID=UPI00095470FA|nr:MULTISPECIES: transporter substrate-binding domain-containing protein [unclassified Paenibacillus]ASS67915.1 transporter substrate-binding domain-containing protein [Paenibacillus sp. RUD330]SIR44134.1 L-cystine transport system substrate-binding protein [Paenibacillus sp. RU4X]SIR53955.1 L-cystine transport system substrate-binding protein [Paenibacillus sp. RU4T]
MKKKTAGVAAAILLTLLLAACGAKENGAEGAKAASAGQETSAPVKKIVVGTGTQFPKVCFIDENGKLTGFDVELVREIDKRLPQYEFEFQTMEFKSILLSLDARKIDFAAHEFEKNPEREEKYLFNKVPYAHWRNKIIVAKDNNDPIESLDDLKGKKFIAGATSAEAQILLNYNKEHGDALKIVYSSGAANDTVSQITTGRVDAAVGADFSLSLIDPQRKLKTVGKPLSEADILFVFRKGEPESQKLSDDIDKALEEVKADGTLAKLSEQWLGGDFTEDSASK